MILKQPLPPLSRRALSCMRATRGCWSSWLKLSGCPTRQRSPSQATAAIQRPVRLKHIMPSWCQSPLLLSFHIQRLGITVSSSAWAHQHPLNTHQHPLKVWQCPLRACQSPPKAHPRFQAECQHPQKVCQCLLRVSLYPLGICQYPLKACQQSPKMCLHPCKTYALSLGICQYPFSVHQKLQNVQMTQQIDLSRVSLWSKQGTQIWKQWIEDTVCPGLSSANQSSALSSKWIPFFFFLRNMNWFLKHTHVFVCKCNALLFATTIQ